MGGKGMPLVAFVCLFSSGAFFNLAFGEIPRQPLFSRITQLYHIGTPEGRDPHPPLTAQRHNTGGSSKCAFSANAIFPGTQPEAWQPQPRGALGMLHWNPPCLRLPQPCWHNPGNLLGVGQPWEPPLPCKKVKHKSFNFFSLEKCSGWTFQE